MSVDSSREEPTSVFLRTADTITSLNHKDNYCCATITVIVVNVIVTSVVVIPFAAKSAAIVTVTTVAENPVGLRQDTRVSLEIVN